jgi:hypothetical protein
MTSKHSADHNPAPIVPQKISAYLANSRKESRAQGLKAQMRQLFPSRPTDVTGAASRIATGPRCEGARQVDSERQFEGRFSPQEVFQDLPGDLVFFEQPSTLVDAKGNKIPKFF